MLVFKFGGASVKRCQMAWLTWLKMLLKDLKVQQIADRGFGNG